MYKLRELERKDLSEINRWRNDPSLIRFLGAPYRYINEEVDERWFDNYMSNRKTNVRCAIVSEDCDDILGMVILTNIDYINQSALFHIQIGDDRNQNNGIGTFALKAMLKHAFYDLNLRRIELGVLLDNVRAQHLYEKCGFKKEGIRREAVYKGGNFVDMIAYSILRSEYIQDGGVIGEIKVSNYRAQYTLMYSNDFRKCA